MNILFLSMTGSTRDLNAPGIYTDLLREFVHAGHRVYVVDPAEKRTGEATQLIHSDGWSVLRVRVGNVQKSGLIEKGIAQLCLEGQFWRAICRYLKGIRFELIIYSTPPITLAGVIRRLKKAHRCPTYLLLKDIFPQNAVDLGMFSAKSPIYWYFRRMERKLYALADHIGCMSQANAEYVLRHNPEIDPAKVEICPNSRAFLDMRVDEATRTAMRQKYDLPLDRKIFVYGGNLGKPQGVEHLINCIRTQKGRDDRFFLVVGSGTEYGKLEAFATEGQENFRLMSHLPKEDYDRLAAACDVGLIFLDHRFTIPNFPSRLLSYMQAGLPVLCCTDPNTDIGKVCVEGGFGWYCESKEPQEFRALADEICRRDDLTALGAQGIAYLQAHYTAQHSCDVILKALQRQ